MARYRLRFLLQEFDLPTGDTLIGRGTECRISIEDPLVSRQHARVRLMPDGTAVFEDLNSRNGSRVNGALVRGPQELHDGDRLRIGTQELVFCRVATIPHISAKQTGFLRHCAECHVPYPEEMVACPNCGSTERADETERQTADVGGSWSMQLLAEVLDRAVSLGRKDDCARLMKRIVSHVDERANDPLGVDARQLAALDQAVAGLAALQNDTHWLAWAIDVHLRLRIPIDAAVVAKLDALAPHLQRELGHALAASLARAEGRADDEAVASLERLRDRLLAPPAA